MKKNKLVLTFCLSFATVMMMAQTGSYTWKNAQIEGGGFISGIVYNETEPGLVYTRTDIGGLYRLDTANQEWTPLLDWVGWDNWGYSGVVSVATDPINPNNVYAAVGGYTNSWDPNNGAILKSTDKGNTWTTTTLPFKLGGNMPGRGCGERLAIDPNDDNILYLATPSGHGLWKSTDAGASWSQVTSFPNPGNYAQDLTDPYGYLTDNQGIYWVVFDKSTGTVGSASQSIYVGVADTLGPCIYQSTDGGSTWSAIPNQFIGELPHKGVFDAVNGVLYVAYSNRGGPYDGSFGYVYKYSKATGTWTDISPYWDPVNTYFGYSGLSVCSSNPNIIMVTGYSSWWPETFIFRSTDGGATWSNIWNWTRYPNMSHECVYPHDISAAPWLSWTTTYTTTKGGGRPGPDVPYKLGWMTEALAINPFDANTFLYGTGATLYGTHDANLWDDNDPNTLFHVSVMAKGIEETSIQCVVSPPSGPQLVSAIGDIKGFRWDNVDVVPSTMFPTVGAPTYLDFAELSPQNFLEVETPDEANGHLGLAISGDAATTWTMTTAEPSGITGGGTAAYAADASMIVWAPVGTASGAYYSSNPTGHNPKWTSCSGFPVGGSVHSDRVNANKFYGFYNGTFYISTNKGADFSATSATGLPSSGKFKAVPGNEGDIWLVSGGTSGGVWHSTNSGTSFTKLSNVTFAESIGFGQAAPGQTYMAIYIEGEVGGIRGYFRSDDEGATWVRINDDQHQWYYSGNTITGDPRIYGRVYIGTNGRGVIYGDIAGAKSAQTSGSEITANSNGSINVYPNPVSNNELTLICNGKISQNMAIRISDMSGRVVYQKNTGSDDFIANRTLIRFTEKLSTGIYVINVKTVNNDYTTRFVVR